MTDHEPIGPQVILVNSLPNHNTKKANDNHGYGKLPMVSFRKIPVSFR